MARLGIVSNGVRIRGMSTAKMIYPDPKVVKVVQTPAVRAPAGVAVKVAKEVHQLSDEVRSRGIS